MHFIPSWVFVFVFSVLSFVPWAHASLYVIEPAKGVTCHGGQLCTVEWLDDGEAPLLDAIGACTIGLYTGKQQLVQQIQPVNVASTHSLTFTPNPKAGPDSGSYYIGFASTSLKESNGTQPLLAFSPFFTINQMQGSFASSLPSAVSSIPVPSTVSNPPLNTILSTVTIGNLSTSPSVTPSSVTPHSSSGFTTSPAPSSTTLSSPVSEPTTSTGSPSSSSHTSSARSNTSIFPVSVIGILSLYFAVFSFVFIL